MTNTATVNNFRTKLSEALRDYRENRQWRRNEYLDLRQAGIETRRVKHAVSDLSNGMLNRFEAEEVLEMANSAVSEYDFNLDTREEFRVAPILLRVLLFVGWFMTELVAAVFVLDRFWTISDIWNWPEAAMWGVSLIIFVAIALLFDLGGFFGFNGLCKLFMKLRIAQLNRYIDALEAFAKK